MKIGTTLPQAGSDAGIMPRYVDIRTAALHAERDDFDSIWIMDHLLFEWEGQPRAGVWEGLTILSALSEATERVELGTLVLCTAFRNPAGLAKMADAIDEISGGRLILGLGAGWHEPEFRAFGFPFDHLASRFEEAMNIIAPLVRTGEVDYVGEFERAPNCVSLPRGPRPGGPSILVGAGGPRLLRVTARQADAWNTCWPSRAHELPGKMAPMLAACAEVGRDPESLEVTVGQIVSFKDIDVAEGGPAGAGRDVFADAADLASEWSSFANQGVGHIIIWAMPDSEDCVDLVTSALQIYRTGGAA